MASIFNSAASGTPRGSGRWIEALLLVFAIVLGLGG